MKNLSIHISLEQLQLLEKAKRRKELIEAGQYNAHKNQTFKDKKTYSRKSKIDFDE